MKILIDMNLSPKWVEVFMAAELDATHWFAVGDPRARHRGKVCSASNTEIRTLPMAKSEG